MGTITKAELKDHDVEAASISEHPGPKLKDLKSEKYKDSELKSDKSIKSGKTKKNDTWTGHGGATTGKQAAFGGATSGKLKSQCQGESCTEYSIPFWTIFDDFLFHSIPHYVLLKSKNIILCASDQGNSCLF